MKNLAVAAVLFVFIGSVGAAEKYSWQNKHAKVSMKGEVQWVPEPFAYRPGKSVRYIDHAMGTDRQAKPNVTIALKKPELLRLIVIENRRDSYGRYMVGLAAEVWLDGKTWKKVWQGTEAQSTCTIDIKTPVRARYVRIALTGDSKTSYFALTGVKIYALK